MELPEVWPQLRQASAGLSCVAFLGCVLWETLELLTLHNPRHICAQDTDQNISLAAHLPQQLIYIHIYISIKGPFSEPLLLLLLCRSPLQTYIKELHCFQNDLFAYSGRKKHLWSWCLSSTYISIICTLLLCVWDYELTQFSWLHQHQFKSNIYPWSCQSFGQLSNKGDTCCPPAKDSTNELSDLFIKGREIWSFIPEALVGNLHENFMLFTCRSPSLLRCPSPHCRKRSCYAPANPLIEILNSKGVFSVVVVLKKSWDQEVVCEKKKKKVGLWSPGWLFDSSGRVETSVVCSGPIEDQKNNPFKKLWPCRKAASHFQRKRIEQTGSAGL